MSGNLLRISKDEFINYVDNIVLLRNRIYPEKYIPNPNLLDLNIHFENIYFLLTECTTNNFKNAEPPLSLILFNGSLLPQKMDMAYGQPNYCSQEEVKAIALSLPDFSIEQIRLRFESTKFKESVLYYFESDRKEEILEEIFEIYINMRDFYRVAAENDQLVISFII
jgi:hypothetical protein